MNKAMKQDFEIAHRVLSVQAHAAVNILKTYKDELPEEFRSDISCIFDSIAWHAQQIADHKENIAERTSQLAMRSALGLALYECVIDVDESSREAALRSGVLAAMASGYSGMLCSSIARALRNSGDYSLRFSEKSIFDAASKLTRFAFTELCDAAKSLRLEDDNIEANADREHGTAPADDVVFEHTGAPADDVVFEHTGAPADAAIGAANKKTLRQALRSKTRRVYSASAS